MGARDERTRIIDWLVVMKFRPIPHPDPLSADDRAIADLAEVRAELQWRSAVQSRKSGAT